VSIASVVGRVQELEALVRPPAAAPTGPASGTSFATQLSTAQAAGATAPLATASTGGGPTAYDAQIQAAAARNGVDPALLKGLIRQESNFDPNAGSPAGAQGLMQLMPGTARELGVIDALDPAQNLDGGTRYLRMLVAQYGGDLGKALAAYNAGPGAVQRYGGVPPYAETQNYVRQVQAYAAQYRTATAGATTSVLSPTTSLPYSTT
jgi:soluble lytic murein transglycosylase-like protein